MKPNENKVPQNIDKEAWGSDNIAHSNLVKIMAYNRSTQSVDCHPESGPPMQSGEKNR